MAAAARVGLTKAVRNLASSTDDDTPPGWYAMYGGRGGKVQAQDIDRARRLTKAASIEQLKRGRTGYPDDHYRRIALAYLDLLAMGNRRGILNKLAEQETNRLARYVPRETVRTWVRRARELQFLTAGEPGRAGAEPGPRLRMTSSKSRD